MPLTMVKIGNRVRILNINAGRRLQSRLADLGLLPGVEVNVINSSFGGPLILGVKGSRIVIGHGMALKIDVQ